MQFFRALEGTYMLQVSRVRAATKIQLRSAKSIPPAKAPLCALTAREACFVNWVLS